MTKEEKLNPGKPMLCPGMKFDSNLCDTCEHFPVCFPNWKKWEEKFLKENK